MLFNVGLPSPKQTVAQCFAAAAICILPAAVQAECRNFVAYLDGIQGVNPTFATARGTGRFVVDTTANTMQYFIDYGGLSSSFTAAHVHGPASSNQDAPPVHAFAAANPITGVWTYPESLEADILAGRTYVNIHTTNFPGGEIRGQVVTYVAPMDGPQSSTPSTATGIGLFTLDPATNVLSYVVRYTAVASETAGHFHGYAPHSQSGGVLANLASPVTLSPSGLTERTGTITLLAADVPKYDSGLAYVNVHSNTFGAGEIRGQIVRRVATLNSLQQTGSLSSNAVGTATFSLNTDLNQLGWWLSFSGLSSAESAAHLHGPAARGTDAPPVISFPPGNPKVGMSSYAESAEADLVNGLYYANVHTSNFPAGEIRGQMDAPLQCTSPVADWSRY